MSTSTTHRSSSRAYVGVAAAPDEPQFQVRFTPDNDAPCEPATNSFRWSGWGTLHIGARGLLVSARRRGWMGFHRRERRFFPSADIRGVYREGGAVRVDLRAAPAGQQSFQFWPADLRTASTIVALLPTANTVEIDAPSAGEAPAPARRISPAVWVLTVAATAVAGLIAASVAFLRQGEASVQSASSATEPTPTVPVRGAALSAVAAALAPRDPEVLRATAELERLVPQIEGLRTQFSTAFTSLQLGAVSREVFADGMQNWLLPQWQLLDTELANDTPLRTSIRYRMHHDLAATVAAWEEALRSYAQGLRDGDNARNLAALSQLKRADELEQQAQHRLASLQMRIVDETNTTSTR